MKCHVVLFLAAICGALLGGAVLGGFAAAGAATVPSGAQRNDGEPARTVVPFGAERNGSGPDWVEPGPREDMIPFGLLFDSGTPVTDPNFTCGSCYAWSSTYFASSTDYDRTARRFSVPPGSFATAFRLWWAYGEEGPHPNSANLGGGPADFSSISLDLYDTSGPGGAPGAHLATLTGTWTVLDAATHYKEFTLDAPFGFASGDYYVSLRGETALSGYQATLLWLTCAPDDPWIDYEDYFNSINGTTSGWADYPSLPPCYDDLDFGLQVLGGLTPDLVHLDPEDGCINATSPCRTVDFDFERADASAVRGFSVTFRLTDLLLCGGVAGIEEGSYLRGHCGGGCTAFEVIDHLDGTYTVDGAILGAACGPDSSGTLFSIEVGSALSSGVGTVEVLQVIVRDCVNHPVPGLAGDDVAIAIDTIAPVPVGDLATVQRKTGNGSGATTAIEVLFSDPGATAFEVYRAPFGDGSGSSAYAEYDDAGGTPPPAPSYPPGPPWTLTAVTASGEFDTPPHRGFWYYAVFGQDECGNVSAVSNLTPGCLDYHLGDVSDGATPGQGDNAVLLPDISLLGAHYGSTLVPADPYGYLDVGPTDDHSVDGLPTTDNRVDFEDIILFAINYAQVGLTGPTPAGEISWLRGEDGADAISLRGAPARDPEPLATWAPEGTASRDDVPEFHCFLRPTVLCEGVVDDILEIHFDVDSTAVGFNGYELTLHFDPEILEPIGVLEGTLMTGACASRFQNVTTTDSTLTFSHVILCAGVSVEGPGRLSTYRFKAVGAGESEVSISSNPDRLFVDAGLWVWPMHPTDPRQVVYLDEGKTTICVSDPGSAGLEEPGGDPNGPHDPNDGGEPGGPHAGALAPLSLRLVPNPGRDVHVELWGAPAGSAEVEILGPDGRRLGRRTVLFSAQASVRLALDEIAETALPAGSYFVRARREGGAEVIEKLVVLR